MLMREECHKYNLSEEPHRILRKLWGYIYENYLNGVNNNLKGPLFKLI